MVADRAAEVVLAKSLGSPYPLSLLFAYRLADVGVLCYVLNAQPCIRHKLGRWLLTASYTSPQHMISLQRQTPRT